jgi:hypothetical protein
MFSPNHSKVSLGGGSSSYDQMTVDALSFFDFIHEDGMKVNIYLTAA